MAAREREKQRLSRPIHIMRADIRLGYRSGSGTNVNVPARALLNEFTPSGICLYTTTPLTPNLDMILELNHPKKFTLKARVVWCQYQPSSNHVLTAKPYAYRLGLAFSFDTPEQADVFKKFCEEMTERYAQSTPGAPMPPLSSEASTETPSAAPTLAAVPSPEAAPDATTETAAVASAAPNETPAADTPSPSAENAGSDSVADILSQIDGGEQKAA